VSIDLIYARAGQSVAQWRGELAQALSWGAGHLSAYQLTIEPGTAFARRVERGAALTPPDEEAADLFNATQDLTAAKGLPAYEISNHARAGEESRHNRLHWTGGSWLGLGPGAASRLDADDRRLAWRGVPDAKAWLQDVETGGDGLAERDVLDAEAVRLETLLTGLRTSRGVERALVSAAKADPLLEDGWLEETGSRIHLSTRAKPVLNAVLQALV
jgi:oxygen-independent coproporphyrinogen-3 oxidase